MNMNFMYNLGNMYYWVYAFYKIYVYKELIQSTVPKPRGHLKFNVFIENGLQ